MMIAGERCFMTDLFAWRFGCFLAGVIRHGVVGEGNAGKRALSLMIDPAGVLWRTNAQWLVLGCYVKYTVSMYRPLGVLITYIYYIHCISHLRRCRSPKVLRANSRTATIALFIASH